MKRSLSIFSSVLAVGILSAGLAAQTSSAARYDQDIQARVEKQLADKKSFRNVEATTEDGIVTLTGSVELYQQKLDAAKKVRKSEKVNGVRNLIAVSTNVPDEQLSAQLNRKLYYDRIGYDNRFNYVTASVKDGVVILLGETRTDVSSDSAQWLASNLPGVKEVVNDIQVAPASNFDDDIRVQATRAIYRDPVLSRYAADPAAPIRIVVNNGTLSLYGTVNSAMDKNMAGIRANSVFGVFKVQNNLEVASRS
jgi:hyperosmotically inducible periplasmic protein